MFSRDYEKKDQVRALDSRRGLLTTGIWLFENLQQVVPYTVSPGLLRLPHNCYCPCLQRPEDKNLLW